MSEPHKLSTLKTCPLMGSHFLRIETSVKGIHLGTQQANIPTLVSCNGEGCEWWDDSLSSCTYVVQTAILHQIDDALTGLRDALGDLIEHIKKEGR